MSDSVFELRIELPAGSGGDQRDRLCAWLRSKGHEPVEGIIDGVRTPLPACLDAQMDNLFEESPISVYLGSSDQTKELARLVAAVWPGVKTYSVAWDRAGLAGAWEPTPSWHYHTERFCLRSPDIPPDAVCASRLDLSLGQGEAFGGGDHATTKVALLALDRLLDKQNLPTKFLDVGTGNGILAIAAALSGVQDVWGTDLEAVIVGEARANAIAKRTSVSFLLTDDLPLGPYDAIIANIPAAVLIGLLPGMAAALRQGGKLILAGFMGPDGDELLLHAEKQGLDLRHRDEIDGWIGLTLAKG